MRDARRFIVTALLGCGSFLSSNTAGAQHVMENLRRGLVVVRSGETSAYVGWRLLGTDPADVRFNLYRATADGPPSRLNKVPLTTTTDFVDTTFHPALVNTYA